ncbi:MAG TPA: GNAT family N-acetyltransferase [Candidatus Limnocylindria bacterium]|nr:GNAT family N-acetyltransferase [Candidatus Limnocylindria bacterium]
MAVLIPGAPAIPGLAFRRLRAPADYAEIAAVFNAVAAADHHFFRVTPEGVAHWYAHPDGWDPATDELIVEVDGRIVGWADVRYAPDTDGTPVYALGCALLPEVRRRGLGTALLAHNEAQARARAAIEAPGASVLLHASATEHQAGAMALLEKAGYRVARWFIEMVHPSLDAVPEMPMPDGLAIRPMEPADHRAVFDADSEAFQDHWGGIDVSESAFERFFGGPEFTPELWRVAWDGDQVAGVIMVRVLTAYNEEHDARRVLINGVSVRRPWRGRGLARALLADALRGARDAGFTSATLDVDAENPTGALGVYEAVGFEVDSRSRAYRRPLPEG